MINSLTLSLLFLAPQILANTWVKLGTCAGWDYTNVATWGGLACSTTNLCSVGTSQSPTKISSELTTTDGSLQALTLIGYGVAGQLSTNLMHYDGRDIYVDYYGQGNFENPGARTPFTSQYFRFSVHDEQLGFEALNRMSLDIYHYQTNNNNWNNHPIGTKSVSVLQMLFQVGAASKVLDPFFQAMRSFTRPKNISAPVQTQAVSWSDLGAVFQQLSLNKTNGYYRFLGSIPEPPCQETVEYYRWEYEWTISQAQLTILTGLLGELQRPVQGALSKVPYFDPLVLPPAPFSFRDLSVGGIAAIVLAITFILVSIVGIICGLFVKSSATENYATF